MVLSFSTQPAKIFQKECLLQGGLTYIYISRFILMEWLQSFPSEDNISGKKTYCVKLRLSRASIRCEAIAVHSFSMHFFPSAVALCFSLGFPKYG